MLPLDLSDLSQPTWGGHAGHYLPRTSSPTDAEGLPFYWNEASDTWNGSTSRDSTAARFAAVVQNAFRARWDWCYMTFAQANHDPIPTVTINGGNAVTMGLRRISLAAGSTVSLAATVADPDTGDTHTFAWTYYPEAGTYAGDLAINNANAASAPFTIPSNAVGKQLHVYLAVTDDGSRKGNRVPNLTRFCRVVVDVASGEATSTTTYQAETLTHTQSDTVTTYSEAAASGGHYDFLAANAVGDYVEYSVTVATPGTYQIAVRYKAMASRGIAQLKIGSTPQGSPFDQRASGFLTVDLGSRSLAVGTHLFRFEVTGTTGTGYSLSIDAITLTGGGDPELEPVSFEAETLDFTSSDTVTSYNETAASAGSYDFVGSNAIGDHVTYTVDVPTAATYQIEVR